MVKNLQKKEVFTQEYYNSHYAAMRHPENHEHILDVSVRPLAKTKRHKDICEFRTAAHRNIWKIGTISGQYS